MTTPLPSVRTIRAVLALTVAALFCVAFAPSALAARDSDGDGMPNRWERSHGLAVHKANAGGNPDRDGLSNLREYKNGSHPKKEDTDRDGIDDGNEVEDFESDPSDPDEDNDGREDGDEDADKDGTKNEDEDDAEESCRADDDDSDRDGIRDEDENEFGTKRLDADSDNDGVEDGDEDKDRDGVENEDEDDDSDDRCDGDRDEDGVDQEDENDVVGNIVSFDSGTGVLVIQTGSGQVSAPISGELEIEWSDCDCDEEGDPTTAALVAGTPVEEFEIEEGVFVELELFCDESESDEENDDDPWWDEI
jgi:hypothetical protein